VQLPPGNLFGFDETTVPVLVLSPSAEQGYYLSCDRYLAEPRPFDGWRWMHFRWLQDITYHLKVGGGRKH
jgi:hypothetical protein